MSLVVTHPLRCGFPGSPTPGRDWFADADRLADHGDAPALIEDHRVITYRELSDLVVDKAREFGCERQLILLESSNSTTFVINYLGALHGGHVPLLVPPDANTDEMVERFGPTVAVRSGTAWRPVPLSTTGVDLHPDLALLLSTSGSTGSPKLVRLSAGNLQSNAAAIAEYLHIGQADVAPTVLPLSYCYGLSVLNSHLSAGATLLMTDLSVTDDDFWELMRVHGGTSIAGVPYTFELLERTGFASRPLASLRYLTQAGGRMDPERVRRFARLGREQGWQLFVMYGQTEATARMAYLPPEFAESQPHCIGRAIPGGRFRLAGRISGDENADPGECRQGELVYEGPNVMLGYATESEDLARGRDTFELRTGDLARVASHGLIEIIGRIDRTAKVQGLRIDLGRLERRLAVAGYRVHCVQAGTRLGVVGTFAPAQIRDLTALVGDYSGLTPTSISCRPVDRIPRLTSGKPDLRAMSELAAEGLHDEPPGEDSRPAGVSGQDDVESELVEMFAALLGRTDVTPSSSFVSLGGDSLSFVGVAVSLEKRTGSLPRDWPRMTIRELAGLCAPGSPEPPRWRVWKRWPRLETSVALRAIAILAVVGSHIGVFDIRGGAQLLIAIVGYNFARFHLTTADRIRRIAGAMRSLARVVIPTLLWLLPLVILSTEYSAGVLLGNNLIGPADGDAPEWRYWFIEAMAYLLIAAVALLAVPAFDRWERRRPFALPIMLVGFGVGLAVLLTEPDTPGGTRSPLAMAWVFALGWALGKAVGNRRRLVVVLIGMVLAPALLGQVDRTVFLAVGLAGLAALGSLALPPSVTRIATELAGASLVIYLTHWQVYPLVAGGERAGSLVEGSAALLASLVFGVLVWRIGSLLVTRLSRRPVNSPRCQQQMIKSRVPESIPPIPTP